MSCDFSVKQIGEEDDGFFRFEGLGSTFKDIDSFDERVERGAFVESLKKRFPSLLWQHQISEPIGKFTQAFENESGLFLSGIMPKEDSLVSGRVIPQMKIGSVRTMSIGYRVLESTMEKVGDKVVTVLTKLELLEVSLVTIPANPGAVVTGMKSVSPFQDLPLPKKECGAIDFDRAWNADTAIERIKKKTGGVSSPSSDYKNAFLWHDRSNPEDFTSYKMPILDVIEDKLVPIPRAIFSSSIALMNSKGVNDIPEEDKPAVIENINKYYEKMGLDSPFQKGFKSTIEALTHIKSISGFLKDFGLSNTETNVLLSRLKSATRNEFDSRNDEIESVKCIEGLLKNMEDLTNFTKETLLCQKKQQQLKKSDQLFSSLDQSLKRLQTTKKALTEN